jgi:hypothetical protein
MARHPSPRLIPVMLINSTAPGHDTGRLAQFRGTIKPQKTHFPHSRVFAAERFGAVTVQSSGNRGTSVNNGEALSILVLSSVLIGETQAVATAPEKHPTVHAKPRPTLARTCTARARLTSRML